MGAACNASVPTNCPTGKWIDFKDTGECICIAWCSDFQNIGAGDNCTTDGSWQCQKIEATNASNNSATACVPVKWNLCTAGGGGGTTGGGAATTGGDSSGDTTGGGDTGGGDTGGGECKASGDFCDDNAECCSGSCFISCD